jgi:hypothetical protein
MQEVHSQIGATGVHDKTVLGHNGLLLSPDSPDVAPGFPDGLQPGPRVDEADLRMASEEQPDTRVDAALVVPPDTNTTMVRD